MSKTLLFLYSFLVIFIVVRKHPVRTGSITIINYKYKKTWVLASACSSFRAFHSLSKKQTEKHPRRSICTPVKCASEDMVSPRSTLRRVYTTPRGVTPAFVSVCCSIVEVLNDQKQSVSNAFQYVVLHPSAPSSSDDITALRADSTCKDTK